MRRLIRKYAMDVALPALMLLAGYLSFVKFSGYPPLRLELAICAAALIVVGMSAGLLGLLGGRITRIIIIAGAWTLFIDLGFEFWDWHPNWLIFTFLILLAVCTVLQKHLVVISTTAVSVLLVSTVLLPVGHIEAALRPQPKSSVQSVTHDLSPVIHIILDGHIGISGLPSELPGAKSLRTKLLHFFEDHDFLLFSNAYSHYFMTKHSIPATLNFSDKPNNDLFAGNFHAGDTIIRNLYFERMIKLGYQITVVQTDWVDFCQTPNILVTNCYTIPGTGLQPLKTSELKTVQKSRIILSQFLELSLAYKELRSLYKNLLQPALDSLDISVPDWDWERKIVFPIIAPKSLQLLTQNIINNSTGHLHFAHISIPHEPYVFHSDCSIRSSLDDWADRNSSGDSDLERKQRYQLYLEQVSCTHKLLKQMFATLKEEGIYDRATIVVHGDHGSRIMSAAPRMANEGKLSSSDLTAGFSTLFAVKSPILTPGVNNQVLPIDWLLESVLFQASELPSGKPYIYLADGQDLLVPSIYSPLSRNVIPIQPATGNK